MIKIIVGGVGSGKSTSVIRELLMSKHHSFINFIVPSNIKNVERMKNKYVFAYNEKGKVVNVNWEFWRDKQKEGCDFNIFLDEAHNKFHSRQSMSKPSIMFSKWLSQIRHILGNNEVSDIIIITQDIEGVDIIARRLAQEVIHVSKIIVPKYTLTKCLQSGRYSYKKCPRTYIMQRHFFTDDAMKATSKYLVFVQKGIRTYRDRKYYYANPLFKYNDSYQLIENSGFEPEEWL